MIRFIAKISRRYVALFLTLAILWLMLSGYYHNATLLIFGLASILLAIWFTARAGMMDCEGVPTSIFPGIIPYMIWLTFEIGKANIAVLGHAFRPSLKLSPKMVRVPLRAKSDLGKVLFANSITLTPGTVSIDLTDDEILVHGLTEELAEITGMIEMGDKVCAFDEIAKKHIKKEAE
ncbi:MAG: Na+/H+ antiporter subunit E [bacterium]